ncbi:hypothetical protein R3P38DRAFT_1628701 [Favolaschia claudopus]|uniref:Uncharacterized protein n=1 Tax=Favolaschia claudopus TaxID=2862362 RepID=A0AAW0DFK7_9AGAR
MMMFGFSSLLFLGWVSVSCARPAAIPTSTLSTRQLQQAQILGPLLTPIINRDPKASTCTEPCRPLNDDLNADTTVPRLCTVQVVGDVITCINCLSQAGVFSIESMVSGANNFTESWNAAGANPLGSVEITTNSGGSQSASTSNTPPNRGNPSSNGNTDSNDGGPGSNVTGSNINGGSEPSSAGDNTKPNGGYRTSVVDAGMTVAGVLIGVLLVGV